MKSYQGLLYIVPDGLVPSMGNQFITICESFSGTLHIERGNAIIVSSIGTDLHETVYFCR